MNVPCCSLYPEEFTCTFSHKLINLITVKKISVLKYHDNGSSDSKIQLHIFLFFFFFFFGTTTKTTAAATATTTATRRTTHESSIKLRAKFLQLPVVMSEVSLSD